VAAIAIALGCAHASAVDVDRLAALEQNADLVLAQARAELPSTDILVLEAMVNGLPRGTVLVYSGGLGGIAIEEAALKRWRVISPDGAALEVDGQRFIPLRALPGARATIETRAQQLVVTLPAQLFDPNDIALYTGRSVAPSPPPWSAFANYEIFGYTSKDSSYGSGLFEIGTGGPYGTGIATAVINSAEASGGNTGRGTLLEAAWRYDDPAALRTLVGGTAISRNGAWGRALRFGGVQYGTNFSLQPNLITYPVPAFGGTAVVPSTVDVFVNGSRVGTQQVTAGPFDITNVPVVTGSGDVQLIIRDAFGQQQVVTQPFYASRQLLKPGLDDFTISIGAERRNYGIESFDYGSGLVSAYWRRGLTDTVSLELLANGDSDARAAGATIDFVPGSTGVVTLGAAGSTGDTGGGFLGVAGYQYQGFKYNFTVRGTWASPNFRTPGDDPNYPLQRTVLASAGYNFGTSGTVGAAWADQQFRNQPGANTGTVSYSVTVSPRLFFNASLSRTQGVAAQTGLFASLVYSLDDKTFAGADVTSTHSSGSTSTVAGATVQRSLPIGEGYGYRVRATTDQQYFAGGVYAGPYGRYSVDVASQDGVAAARATIAGGVGTIGGIVFAARPIVDSFALVRVDGVPDVRIHQNGNFAGRTDREGNVVITQLYPYAPTRVTIDDRDLPIDITLANRDRQVAPYFRSGAIVDFGARKLVNALVEVRIANGAPLPAGAVVHRADSPAAYPVGEGGEVFIADLEYGVPYVAEWQGGSCRFAVDAALTKAEPMPRYGPIACAAVAP
jgi:outer membrane usher protein